jgi:hypothetical protein
MNVKDLIEKLKTFPADTQVLVQGYEDGYDSIKSVNEIAVVKNPDAADYNGEYEDVEAGGKGAVKSVVIMGNRR